MSNDNHLFERVRELCICNAKAIVQISKECNTKPWLVANLFMEVMQEILNKTNEEVKR